MCLKKNTTYPLRYWYLFMVIGLTCVFLFIYSGPIRSEVETSVWNPLETLAHSGVLRTAVLTAQTSSPSLPDKSLRSLNRCQVKSSQLSPECSFFVGSHRSGICDPMSRAAHSRSPQEALVSVPSLRRLIFNRCRSESCGSAVCLLRESVAVCLCAPLTLIFSLRLFYGKKKKKILVFMLKSGSILTQTRY